MVNKDLKTSDFSVISWTDLLLAADFDNLEPSVELEVPATSGGKMAKE